MNDQNDPDAVELSTSPVAQEGKIRGHMFLYQQPEVLTLEDHGSMGLSSIDAPYRFCASARAVPLVTTEFRSAQKFHPIIFPALENPEPLAVTGLIDDVNLFVDQQGRWAVPGYIPAYLRCYPLTLAPGPEDKFAVIFDRAAPMVSETPEEPFFGDGDLSEATRQRAAFCQNYHYEQQRTRAFGEMLTRLDLLRLQALNQTVDGQEQRIAEYYAVDPDRLEALPEATVGELFREGFLAAILAHLFSLDNWQELLRLRSLRASGEAPAA